MSTTQTPDPTSTSQNPLPLSSTPQNTNNLTWSPSLTHPQRSALRAQKGLTIWLTGLSASGKSTIATALESHLLSPPHSLSTYRLDGDNIRHGLNADLGFSPAHRVENIRRIAHVAALFADSCTIAITSFISPYRADREVARKLHEERGLVFLECWVDVSVEEAERRDPKGLYRKARSGELKEFTGVSAPYEEPEGAEIRIMGGETSVEEAVGQIVGVLEERGLLRKGEVQEGGLVEM
ncbi:MAG: hypothetical protein Q9169_003239 [Polycauliona sp. 2 TL-2023]